MFLNVVGDESDKSFVMQLCFVYFKTKFEMLAKMLCANSRFSHRIRSWLCVCILCCWWLVVVLYWFKVGFMPKIVGIGGA